jgi:hypothetical protein
MDFEEVNAYMTALATGIGVRYDLGDEADPVGRRMRDLSLRDGRRLYERMRTGRGVVLDGTASGLTVEGWTSRVDVLPALSADLPAAAVLLRPDAHIAWLGAPGQGLTSALTRWFGTPRPA